jgi:hypothetical protein
MAQVAEGGLTRSLAFVVSWVALVGCVGGGERETRACRLDERATTVPRTEVIVWFRPHTDENTIGEAACELKESPLVVSVYVSPGEPEEAPPFPSVLGPMPPGVIEVTAAQPEDAEQISANAQRLSSSDLLDDVIVSHIDE